jgi:4-amino-4-deoxy-L-arabinose transferase-like glycosyltransferase
MQVKSKQTDILFIIIIASLLFIPFLGKVHLFDWDEINFAESAREMILSGDYLNVQVDFKMFWEKPPLFIWMQVLAMKIFGINEFAARLPNAFAGIFTLISLYLIGRKVHNRKFALVWVLVYAGSLLPHFYFKSGIIDPWFNLFIFSGIYFFIRFIENPKSANTYLILSAVMIGLGTLTKGPVALLIFLLSGFAYLIIKRFRLAISFKQIMLYAGVYALVGGFWFILQIASGNFTIFQDFILYQIRLFQTQDAGHGGFPGYHFIVLLFGVFPASLFALKSFTKESSENSGEKHMRLWMLILFWTVLILFSIVQTKILHYSSLCYFPLTYLAALSIIKTDAKEFRPSKWISGLIIGFSAIFALLVLTFQYLIKHKTLILESDFLKDPFAKANLQADIPQSGWEVLPAVLLIVGILWAFLYFRHNYLKRSIAVFISGLLFINTAMFFIPAQAERISQHAAIEFYKQFEGKDVMIKPYGFKSYAHLFYAKKPESAAIHGLSEKEFFSGKSRKESYAVCKIHRAEDFVKKYPKAEKLYDKNGFVFFKIP